MTTATIDAANGGERVNGGNVGQPRWEIIVSANGDTLWVNGNDGLCWACFSKRFGMNVHRNASMESAASECLRCTHRSAGIDEWAIFRAEVLRYQGVVMGIRIPWLISVYAPHQLVIELMPHPEGRDRPASAIRGHRGMDIQMSLRVNRQSFVSSPKASYCRLLHQTSCNPGVNQSTTVLKADYAISFDELCAICSKTQSSHLPQARISGIIKFGTVSDSVDSSLKRTFFSSRKISRRML